MQLDADVLNDLSVSIFTLQLGTVRSFETSASYLNATWRLNSEDLSSKLHRIR